MKILVINCGSSSIKFELFEIDTGASLASGLFERIGLPEGQQSYRQQISDGETQKLFEHLPFKNHHAGLQQLAHWLSKSGAIEDSQDLAAIGHRVAHGGPSLTEPTIIDDQVVESIREMIPLAPMHNAANLSGIELAMAQWPDIPQVAVFDTAFHHTMPERAHQYALPTQLAQELKIRRYGFHGSSHQYVSALAARLLERPLEEVNLIVLHLGNGASASAIRGGKSVDTSMGMTPLEGLIMGTRCGDLDPGVVLFLAEALGKSVEEVGTILNRESGLHGVCGASDMREVLKLAAAGDAQANLAIEMYAYRIKKYIGAYMAILPATDAIVFTAGVGEHSPEVRAKVCTGLEHLGIRIDLEMNASPNHGPAAIHDANSDIQLLVIPTNEELEIAKQTWDRVNHKD